MKKLISSLILSFMVCSLMAQVQVGNKEYSKSPGKLQKEDFDKLKSRTTYFIIQNKDVANKEAISEALGRVWDVTPFEVVTTEEARTKNPKESAFFDFTGRLLKASGQSATTYYPHAYYTLFILEKNKKGEYEHKDNIYAAIPMHLDSEGMATMISYSMGKKKDFSPKMQKFLHGSAHIENWTPSFMLGYMAEVNDYLKNEDTRSVFDQLKSSKRLSSLTTDTLYVPDYVLTKYDKFTGAEKEIDKEDSNLDDEYPYPIKIVSAEELDKLVMNRKEGVKYLVYVKSSTDKFVSVFDSKDGEMLYSNYTGATYNFKKKDLAKLAKQIAE